MIKYDMIICNVIKYVMIKYDMIKYNMIIYNVIKYKMIKLQELHLKMIWLIANRRTVGSVKTSTALRKRTQSLRSIYWQICARNYHTTHHWQPVEEGWWISTRIQGVWKEVRIMLLICLMCTRSQANVIGLFYV